MSKNDPLKDIVTRIKSCLPADRANIGLHEPQFRGNEWAYVKECLDTGWVSSVGKYVDQFEDRLAEYTGVKKAVAVVNGTAALHISLKLVGVKPNDEVLSPAMTFIATTNAITYCGAIPHFVDSEWKTLGMDADKLSAYLAQISEVCGKECFNKKTQRRIKAVVPMNTFGHPVDIEPLLEVCERYHLDLIEDAAESLGSFYKGKHTGNWGKAAALSFNGNKVVTTGGGGAILTNDPELGKLAKHITTTAKLPHKWTFLHDQIGYNYRMPNINAALGCAQLEQLSYFLESKRQLAAKYVEAFADSCYAQAVVEPPNANSNYWLNAILLKNELASKRDELLQLLHEEGILARPVWTLMHKLSMYQDCPRMNLATAENIEARLINLPSSATLHE
jgi:perosamine synthetase